MLDLVNKMKVLSDVTRLKILKLVLEQEYCVCELQEIIGITQPGISQHLRKLKSAGFVNERRGGQWAYYRGIRERVEEFAEALKQFADTDLMKVEEMREEAGRAGELAKDPGALCRPNRRKGETDK